MLPSVAVRRAVVLTLIAACGGGSSPVTPGADAAPATGADAGAQGDLVVTVAGGKLEADLVGDAVKVRRFLKIPFARPPVGALRWKAPVAADAWTGVRHESSFADACPQLPNQQQSAGSTTEDCLYLNVWAPEPKPAAAPVMIWFHGGGNQVGSASDRLPVPGLATEQQPLFYDGQQFAAKQGVVLVSVNYRLGVLGFFASPLLAAEGSPVGNQGLLDQRLAMQWVKDNIAAFGGDPGNVTLFGESAGAFDVCYQVVLPGSRGLFHRAVSESGGCTAWLLPTPTPTSTMITASIAALTRNLGCDAAADALACLRGKSAADVLAAGPQTEDSSRFNPVVDGVVLPDTPAALFERGEIARVPYLIGSNTDEGKLFTYPLLLSGALTDQKSYDAMLGTSFGALAPQVAAEYPASAYPSSATPYFDAYSDALGDSILGCGTHDTARRAAAAGLKVFMYEFNVPWSIAPTILGASHASEIGHVFNVPWMPDAASQRVSDLMNGYWARFARTGDPNGEGAPTWPAFTVDADVRLQLDPGFAVLTDFRKQRCEFWRNYYRP